jgi:hypothetical protein
MAVTTTDNMIHGLRVHTGRLKQIGGGGIALDCHTIIEVRVGTETTTTIQKRRAIDHEAVPPRDHGIGGLRSPDIGGNLILRSYGSQTLRL